MEINENVVIERELNSLMETTLRLENELISALNIQNIQQKKRPRIAHVDASIKNDKHNN